MTPKQNKGVALVSTQVTKEPLDIYINKRRKGSESITSVNIKKQSDLLLTMTETVIGLHGGGSLAECWELSTPNHNSPARREVFGPSPEAIRGIEVHKYQHQVNCEQTTGPFMGNYHIQTNWVTSWLYVHPTTSTEVTATTAVAPAESTAAATKTATPTSTANAVAISDATTATTTAAIPTTIFTRDASTAALTIISDWHHQSYNP